MNPFRSISGLLKVSDLRAKKLGLQKAPGLRDLGMSDPEETRAELANWALEDDPNNELTNYLNEAFWRIMYTVYLVPDEEGTLLELGANPYFATLLLKWFRRYRLELANFFGDIPEKQGTQKIRHAENGEEEVFSFYHFNSEKEDFPYDDGAFDVVLFCEILEHLTDDPVAAIAEINRVLKPGGRLVLTTPNVARLGNIMKIILGENIYDPYSGYGPYGRHNREYTIGEVRHLLALNGFAIEQVWTASVTPRAIAGSKDIRGRIFTRLVGRDGDLGEYIFVRARKVEESAKVRSTVFYRSRPDLLVE